MTVVTVSFNMLSFVIVSGVILNVMMLCHFAECHYAYCRGALWTGAIQKRFIVLGQRHRKMTLPEKNFESGIFWTTSNLGNGYKTFFVHFTLLGNELVFFG
jgi:hypothetical protein